MVVRPELEVFEAPPAPGLRQPQPADEVEQPVHHVLAVEPAEQPTLRHRHDQCPAWLQHPQQLFDRRLIVVGVFDGVGTHHTVERRIGERQVLGGGGG